MHQWPLMLHHHLWMPMNFNVDSLSIMGLPPFVLIVLVTAVVLAAVSIPPRRQQRQQRLAARSINCRSCGAEHPSFARFCSRCGQRL